MTVDVKIIARRLPTPGIISLASAAALARQAVVDARRAESERQPGEAIRNYDLALGLAEATSWDSPLLVPTRAAAQAGLARLDPEHPEAETRRQEALAWLEHTADSELDAADMADHALLLDPGDPLRPRLIEQAVAAPRPCASFAAQVAQDATDPLARLRLAWSAVREAPKVPEYHVLLAKLDGRRDQDRSADYTVAASLFLGAGERGQARSAAARAHQLDPANPVATVLLADLLRLAGEAEEAVALLFSLQGQATPGPDLGAIIVRALARALELGGRRKDALELIEGILAQPDAPLEDFLFAADVRGVQGDFARARQALDRALEIDPIGLPVIYASVQYWLRAKRPDQAVCDVEHALQRRPVNPYLYVLLGYVNVLAGRGAGLDQQIGRAAELNLDAADAWSWASSLCEDQGDLRAAADALDKALKLRPSDPGLLARQGRILLDLGEYDDATHVLRRCVKRSKTDAESYRLLARALSETERPDKALTVLNRAIKRLPEDGTLLSSRGQVYRLLGDLPAAERDLRLSLGYELNPSWAAELFRVLRDQGDEPTAAAALGECMNGAVGAVATSLWNAGDYSGALAVANVGLEQAPAAGTSAERAQLFMIHGLGEWHTGSGADPEKSLRQAVELNPASASAHVILGAYLVQTGRKEQAAAEVHQARVLDPESQQVALMATDVLRKVKGDAGALAELDEAIRQIGEDPQLLTLRAVLLAEVGQAEAAYSLVTELRGQGVSDARLSVTEGIALTALGRYSEAIGILDAALDANQDSVEVRVNLAYALNQMGEAERAAAILERVSENAVNARILMVRGQIRHNLGDKACLEDLGVALEWDFDLSEARIELIDAAFEFGAKKLAHDHLMVLTQDDRLAADPQVVRLAWVIGERDLALRRAQSILALAETAEPPMDRAACAALVYKSAILLELGEITPALEAARAAVKLNDASPDARLVLSAALKAAGSPDEALAALGSRDNPRLTIQRVQLLLDRGRRDEAVRVVRGVLRAESSDDRLTTGLLDALTAEGMLLQTARMLQLRLVAGPSPWILRSAGLLLSAMGDFPRAIKVLELARRTNSLLPDVDASLAWAYSNLTAAQPRAVLTAANRALRKQPDDLFVLRTKADALLELNREPQARRLYKLIRQKLSSRPDLPYAGSLSGWCSYRLGEYEQALDDLLRTISTSEVPSVVDRFDLGLVLFVAGRPSRAKREFSRAIEECRALPSPLHRHGILQVAMVDLDDAIALGPTGLNLAVGEQLQAMLRKQLKATQPSFAPVRAFLDGIDDVLRPRRRRTNNGPVGT